MEDFNGKKFGKIEKRKKILFFTNFFSKYIFLVAEIVLQFFSSTQIFEDFFEGVRVSVASGGGGGRWRAKRASRRRPRIGRRRRP